MKAACDPERQVYAETALQSTSAPGDDMPNDRKC